MEALPTASGAPPSSGAAPRSTCTFAPGLGEAGPGEAGLGEAGERRLWRRAGWGGLGGNGGGTVGARRLLPTRRRGRAWGVTGLLEPGGASGAGGEERVLQTWGGGMVGRAGAGRLAVEEGWGGETVRHPPQDLCICHSFCQELCSTAGSSSFRPPSTGLTLSRVLLPPPRSRYCYSFLLSILQRTRCPPKGACPLLFCLTP